MECEVNREVQIMKGTVLETIPRGYFTNMKDVFSAIGNQQKNYNWLVSNYECNIYPSSYIPFGKDYVWIDGENLTEIIEKFDIQFIWGVFSGFPKELSVEEIMQYSIPIADGNEKLWDSKVKTQHPLADIEIIPWDSSLVILISASDDIVNKFMKMYPESIDLLEYNSRDDL